ncbi:MAG: hypothetical protein V1663_01065 [archaeon]
MFKLGDKVIIVDKTFGTEIARYSWKIGDIGYIRQIHSEKKAVYNLSKEPLCSEEDGGFYESDLKLVEDFKDIDKRIKTLEDRFKVKIEYKITKNQRR